VTYVTNSELGFDYLRDNMAQDPSALVRAAARKFRHRGRSGQHPDRGDEGPLRRSLFPGGTEKTPADRYFVIAKLVKRLNQANPPS
jgi:preprotein translocase subunit SecA